MVDFSKINSVSDIKNAQENNKDIFTREEKDLYFTNPLVKDDLEKARKVAELLVKVKKAQEAKVANPTLVRELERERDAGNRGSVVHRVLDTDGLLRDAFNYLVFLGRSDFPKDKAVREARINELETDLEKKRIEYSKLDISLLPLERDLKGIVEELAEEEKDKERLEALLVLLSGDTATTKLKVINNVVSENGTETLLSGINITIKDYNNLLSPATRTGTITVKTAVDEAVTFLNAVRKNWPNPELRPYETDLPKNYFNDRSFQTKRSLTDFKDSIGYGVLKALREIGSKKLEKIIDSLSTTTGGVSKDDLKQYVKEIENCIHWHEEILGKGKHYEITNDPVEWDTKYEAWKKSLLKKEKTEYPYVKAIDWENAFALINNLFPVDSNGRVISRPYLTDPDDENYIKPTDSDKGWSETVFMHGYATTFPVSGTKAVVWYAKNDPSASLVLKSQIPEGSKFSVDATFASIMQAWHDCFDKHFQDTTTNKWKGVAGAEKYQLEYEFENGQNMLRFCHTMRETLHALGITSEISEFDDYLLDIASDTELRVNCEDVLTDADNSTGDLSAYRGFFDAIRDKKIWNKDVSSRPKTIKELITKKAAKILVLKNDIEGRSTHLNKQRGGEISNLRNEMSILRNEIDALRELNDISDKPLPDKKDFFNTLYNKKTNGKWLLSDIKSMIATAEMIKTGMSAAGEDYGSSEFKNKETEAILKKQKADEIGGKIYSDYIQYKKSAKSDFEAIKTILAKPQEEGGGLTCLTKISGYFKLLEEEIILDDEQAESYAKIKEAIQQPDKYKDAPTSDLTVDTLSTLFTFTADDNLLSSWKKADDKVLTKSLIETIITNNYSPTKTGYNGLMNHLKEKGDIDKDKTYDISDDSKKLESWQKLIKKGPEKVIKTIICHENDDETKDSPDEAKKTALIKKMRENTSAGYNTDPKQNKFNKTRYGDPTEGNEAVTQEQLINYLFDEKLSKVAPQASAWETSDDSGNNNNEENGKGGVLDHLKANWHWYVIAVVAILALLGIVFWKTIADWWNGPAEEQGKGEVEEGEDKEEEEN